MHVDARRIENGTTIEGDICIIGAGAAGISIALEFMDGPFKVILLEGGGFEYEDRIQELYNGTTSGQPYYPIKSSELHYFGGTTGHWGGYCSPFDPIAFEKRSWIEKSGWPVNRDILDPYYKRACPILDIENFEFDLKYWQERDPSLISMPFDDEVVWTKLWKFSAPTRFGTKFREPIVHAKNIYLYTYANVVDITTNESVSEVRNVTFKNYAGITGSVTARYFILACAGIQNPRILLAANKQAPFGLGNENDLVGRYFMEHAEFKSAELWLNQKSDLKLYMIVQPRVQGEIAVKPKIQQEQEILNGIVSFIPLDYAKAMPSYIELWNTTDPRENEHRTREAMSKTTGTPLHRIIERFRPPQSRLMHQAFQMSIRMEQAPNPLSRVTLSGVKDELGMPRASLHWAFTSKEKRSMRRIYEIIGQQAGASGFGRVHLMEELWDERDEKLPVTTSGGWHHMGTTRMSDDPKNGVVNADCRLHSIQNFYIAGGSIFPTGAGVNPTFTIVALAIRLADHLKSLMDKSIPS